MDIQYAIKPLDRIHDRAAFSCGVEPLDLYLQRNARDDAERGLTSVHVLCDGISIIGYFTLSMLSISIHDLPDDSVKRLPRYPIPVALIGKLAVDLRYQRRKIGEQLLMKAFHMCIDTSTTVACYAVVVEAKGDNARSFYEAYGFIRFKEQEYKLFLPLRTIRASFGIQ